MEKNEKYVVFKYEDEFGFHYMKLDKLPGEGSTYMDPISFEKKINPNCTPGAITQQPFSGDGKSAYVLSSKFVPVSGWWNDKAEVREWQERTRAYKALKELKRKGEDLKLEKASTRSVCPGQPQHEEHIYCSGGLPPHQVNIFHKKD